MEEANRKAMLCALKNTYIPDEYKRYFVMNYYNLKNFWTSGEHLNSDIYLIFDSLDRFSEKMQSYYREKFFDKHGQNRIEFYRMLEELVKDRDIKINDILNG